MGIKIKKIVKYGINLQFLSLRIVYSAKFALYLHPKRVMKKELGKWLMDISKYITTAVVLSSIFGGITETWKILTLGFLTIAISIVTGLILIHSSEKEEKNKK